MENVARRCRTGEGDLDLVFEAPVAAYGLTESYLPERNRVLYQLLILNLLLQIFDGIATYSGLQLGIREANPLLRTAFHMWGMVPALVVSKAQACGLLLLIYWIASEQLAVLALGVLAAVYSVCSLIPWLGVLFALLLR